MSFTIEAMLYVRLSRRSERIHIYGLPILECLSLASRKMMRRVISSGGEQVRDFEKWEHIHCAKAAEKKITAKWGKNNEQQLYQHTWRVWRAPRSLVVYYYYYCCCCCCVCVLGQMETDKKNLCVFSTTTTTAPTPTAHTMTSTTKNTS